MKLFLICSNKIYSSTAIKVLQSEHKSTKNFGLFINCYIEPKSIIFRDDASEPVGSNCKM